MTWQGKVDTYDKLLSDGNLAKKDQEPNIEVFQWYVTAFSELNSCRSTVSLSPLPFTAITEFAKIYSVEDFEDFLYIVRQMDEAYLEFHRKKDGN